MEKKILIIRSVSFQQLDKNLGRIKEMFSSPGTMFYLLTHSHGMVRAAQYGIFNKIIDYESRKNFSFFHVPKLLKKEKFQSVIIPVSNKTSAGFLNVFLMAWKIKTRNIYCCNLNSEMQLITRSNILGRFIKSVFFSSLAFILTLLSLIFLPFLILFFLFFRKYLPASQTHTLPTIIF